MDAVLPADGYLATMMVSLWMLENSTLEIDGSKPALCFEHTGIGVYIRFIMIIAVSLLLFSFSIIMISCNEQSAAALVQLLKSAQKMKA